MFVFIFVQIQYNVDENVDKSAHVKYVLLVSSESVQSEHTQTQQNHYQSNQEACPADRSLDRIRRRAHHVVMSITVRVCNVREMNSIDYLCLMCGVVWYGVIL